MNTVYGIDIGGTQLKACAFTRNGEVLASHSMPLGKAMSGLVGVRESLDALYRSCGQEPDALGIAAPGLAAEDQSSIVCLPGGKVNVEGVAWAEYLKFEKPLKVMNDGHAAMWGEVWHGAAHGLRNAVLLTLGTGVGGAILSEGRLLRGHLGRAGHLGHLCLDPDGPPDICGTPGSLEDFVGNQTIEARTAGRFQSTDQLVAAVVAGDRDAKRIWSRSVYLLACGLASIINVLDPEAVIIGGGIAQASDRLFVPLQDEMDRVEWRPTGQRVSLLRAQLGEWSGAYGAAYNMIAHSGRLPISPLVDP